MTAISEFDQSKDQDNLPLPLIVARKWGFSLQYHFVDEKYWYAIQDWIAGLANVDTYAASQIRTDARRNNVTVSDRSMPYVTSSGRKSPRRFADDESLYRIAQYLRPTKDRLALAAIKDFLAKAGAFADIVRRDPESAELALQNRRERKYKAQGKAVEWIASRQLGVVTRKQLMAIVAALLGTNEYMGALTNTTYDGVFGMNAQELRNHIGIPDSAILRDHFSTMALVYTQAAEEAARVQLSKYDDDDVVEVDDIRAVIITLSRFVGKQVKEMSKMLGIDAVTGQPVLGTGLTKEEYLKANNPVSKINPFSKK